MNVSSVEAGSVAIMLPGAREQETKTRGGAGTATAIIEKQQTESPPYSREKLDTAIEQLNDTMETYLTELRFELHEKSGEYMIKVLNQADGTVLREIPPERVLNMVAYFKETLGMLVDKMI